MNPPTTDEALVRSWREITDRSIEVSPGTFRPDRPVSIDRAALAPLVELAAQAIELGATDARFAMLARVVGDEVSLGITYGQEDAFPDGYVWAVQLSHYEEYGGYKEAISFNDERVVSYSAPTLHEAVRLAWEQHGSPVACRACGGEGEFSRWFQADEEPTGIWETLTEHHDRSHTGRTVCADCNGEGMFVSEVSS